MANFFQSKAYQNIVAYVYGWGASVVILGALFKIMHFPGAGFMLCLGMGVEALIFFASAFEPALAHYDWSRVFPELAEDPEAPKSVKPKKASAKENPIGLEDEDIDTLRTSINQIASSAKNFANLSMEVPGFASNVKSVSENFVSLGETTKQANQQLGDSMKSFAASYGSVNEVMLESSKNLSSQITENYSKLIDGLKLSADSFQNLGTQLDGQLSAMQSNTEGFSQSMAAINSKISALNSLYETQINASQSVGESFGKVVDEISSTVENAKAITVESKQLAKSVSSLNTIYGNMLSAFSNN